MNTPKFTPGPWTAVRSDPAEGADVYWICAGGGNISTELGSMMGGYPHDKRESNANLVAAAPELYEAIHAAVNLLNALVGPDEQLGQAIIKMGCDALARARGETP